MALQTQGSDVLEIAFASAFHHRDDVIGVPQRVSGTGAQAPVQRSLQPGCPAQAFQLPLGLQAIDAAPGANAAVALQNLLANVAGVAPQAPFLHAPGRTE